MNSVWAVLLQNKKRMARWDDIFKIMFFKKICFLKIGISNKKYNILSEYLPVYRN